MQTRLKIVMVLRFGISWLLGSAALGGASAVLAASGSVFLGCAQDDFRIQTSNMSPGCSPITMEAIELQLAQKRDAECARRNGTECQWAGQLECGVGILSGYTGCRRDYSFKAGGQPPTLTYGASAITRRLNEEGVSWVDYMSLQCPAGKVFDRSRFDAGGKGCIAYADRYEFGDFCPAAGNPIYPLHGVKRGEHKVFDQPIQLSVGFDNGAALPRLDWDSSSSPLVNDDGGLGRHWKMSIRQRLILQYQLDAPFAKKPVINVVASRGGGHWESFEKQANKFVAASTNSNVLTLSNDRFLLRDVGGATMEAYDSAGFLNESWQASGKLKTFKYSDGVTPGEIPVAGLLLEVTDQFGRKLRIEYEQPAGSLPPRVSKFTNHDGVDVKLGYDGANNLATLQWADDTATTFLYERANLPWALTGVLDEDVQRHATYDYDNEGRATSTELGGGANKFSVTWANAPHWVVTETFDEETDTLWRNHVWSLPDGTMLKDATGNDVALTAHLVSGVPRLTTRSQPAGSGCEASTSELSYDTRGNVTTRADFNGSRTCHAYETGRNFETIRLEGLARSDVCPADLAAHQVPAGVAQRKITTTWHPLWKLETRRAEPKRITTTVYNDQDDPLTTEVVKVSCVPSDTPTLPDGSKIAVVCLRYEQSTADETGNQGLLATPTGTRKWSYEYNKYGQLTKETDPRLKQTGYEYYDTTVFNGDGAERTMGDLKLVRNALGQTTQYLDYNKRGQVRKIQHPNGSVEQRQYHVRGWLTHVTLTPAAGGVPELTQYEYYPTGLLQKVTQPDGSYASYTWDAAHRLTWVSDSLGNSVHYVLDNAGNREREEYRDSSGALAKTITRTFDELGRMQSSTGLLH